MHNEVDKFLLSHKAEIADDGFSDRVMSLLPARKVNKLVIEHLWTVVCSLCTLVLLYFTNVLDIIITDIKAFILTLPLENDLNQWLYIMGIPMLFIWATTLLIAHVGIKK